MGTGAKDMLNLADFDYQMCLMAEKEFPDEFAVRGALYHLQQAAEKKLKALILLGGENPPHTHDISRLIRHCQQLGFDIYDFAEDVADSMTLWESKARYDPYIDFSERKYNKAKEVFERLSSMADEQLNAIEAVHNDSSKDTQEDDWCR